MKKPVNNYLFRGKQVIFTNHAIDRLNEIDMPVEKAKRILRSGSKVRKGFWLKTYKLMKYGHYKLDYYRNGGLLYTVNERPEKAVIVTVHKE